MTSDLPSDIETIIAWLVKQANAYKRIADGTPRLQWREVEGFKSDLMLNPERWQRDRVPLSAFSAECISAGLTSKDTALLVDPLRRRQSGRSLRPKQVRKGWTYEGVINAAALPDSDDPAGQIGVPSEDW